jgi:hypothetical protein
MAIWQFKIELIPKEWAINHVANVNKFYVNDSYDSGIAWNSILLASIDLDVFDRFYNRYEGWHEDHICWGNEEDTDIKLWKNGAFVESISIRLNASGNVNSDILNIAAIAQFLGCYLFIPELRIIIEPNEFFIRNSLMRSRAAVFVKDPIGFLSKEIEEYKNLAAVTDEETP